MKDYTIIYQLIGSIFASDLGCTNEESDAAFDRQLKHAPYKAALREAVQNSFIDQDFSWASLFEQYEVATVVDEEDARNLAREMIYSKLTQDSIPKAFQIQVFRHSREGEERLSTWQWSYNLKKLPSNHQPDSDDVNLRELWSE